MNSTPSRIWLRALNCLLFIFAFAAPMNAGEIEVPFEPMPPSSPEVKKLVSIAEAGALDKAVAEARKLTANQPDNLDAWMFLGLIQAGRGEYEKALAAFEKGLRKTDADLPFLLMMARVHEDRGHLGPGGVRIGGGVRYTRVPDNIDREAFKAEQFRAAAKCFERALEIRPGVKPYQAKRAVLLLAAGDAQTAYDATREYVKVNPDTAVLWSQLANASQRLGRWPEARAAAERCLALNHYDAQSCFVMAHVFRAENNDGESKKWQKRGEFYTNIPEFLAVPYNEETDALMHPVLDARGVKVTIAGPDDAEKPEPKETDEQRNKRRQAAVAAIDNLIAKKTDVSSQLLGAIAFSHWWHGDVENRIYDELKARKDEALLVLLLKKAQSSCTIRGCALALARLKSDAALPLIADLLPNDRGMFSMGIPEALAIYERPEAAAVLTAALEEALGRNKNVRHSPENFMSGFGEGMFIERCIWALKDYKMPEVQQALEKAAKEEPCKADACAVLFLQTRDKAYYKQLMTHLRKQPGDAKGIAHAFRMADLPQAAEIEKIAQAEEKKREREKQKQAKRARKRKNKRRGIHARLS